MSDKTFNFIRFLSEVAVSMVGAIYYGLAEKIGLPYGETVVAICAAISGLLGIFTEWQRWNYKQQQACTDDTCEIKETE